MMIDGIRPDGTLRHSVPTHMLMRVFLIACGTFVLGAATIELHRGAWPINLFSLPFMLILVGAFAVGIPMILVGLVGPSLDWTVAPGRIDIEMTNPFGRRQRRFSARDVERFYVSERDGDGGPSQWRVIMKSTDGKRYESRFYESRDAAERLKREIESIFYGEAA